MNAFSNKLRATLHKSPDIKAFITHIDWQCIVLKNVITCQLSARISSTLLAKNKRRGGLRTLMVALMLANQAV